VNGAGYLVAQISDFHIVARGSLAMGKVDTAAFLRAAVEHLNGLDPPPDVVLATGDLTDNATADEYEHLRTLLAPLKAPLRQLPGNHDDRDLLAAAFPESPELRGRYVQYVVDGPVRVVCLDTSRPPAPGGRLDASQLMWLDRVLAAAPAVPTVVACHHPPFATGIAHMDAMGLDTAGAARFGAVIDGHRQVERIQCGHLHRSITTRWHGTIAATAPSVAHGVALELRAGKPSAWTLEPPAALLHWWRPELGLVTHLSPIGHFPTTPYH
jgi:3',5'-cyclic AMP phosphodiesterase CpdA